MRLISSGTGFQSQGHRLTIFNCYRDIAYLDVFFEDFLEGCGDCSSQRAGPISRRRSCRHRLLGASNSFTTPRHLMHGLEDSQAQHTTFMSFSLDARVKECIMFISTDCRSHIAGIEFCAVDIKHSSAPASSVYLSLKSWRSWSDSKVLVEVIICSCPRKYCSPLRYRKSICGAPSGPP